MKRRILSLTLAALLVLCLLTGCGAKTFTVQEARSGVARVLSFYDRTYYEYTSSGMEALWMETVVGSGSAFGVGESGKETDIFVTNRHVVESESATPCSYTDGSDGFYTDKLTNVYILLDDYAYDYNAGLDTSRSVPCTVIYEADDDEADLAVLKAADPVPGRIALPLLAPDAGIESGDAVYALGYPGSTDAATEDASGQVDYAGSVEKVTVTNGIVSLHTTYTDSNNAKVRIIQHTATVNHGNSGGPLITEKGAVAGVNTWIFGQDLSTGDSMAFASIEIDYVQDVLDDLKISYDVYPAGPSGAVIAVIIVAAVVLAAAVAVVLVLALRRKTGSKEPVGVGVNTSAGGMTPPPPPAGYDSGYRVQAVSGAFTGRRFPINGQVRIGRDPAKNDLVYPANTQGISAVHCVLKLEGDQLYLKDLGSTYGTFLSNGQRLAASQAVRIQKGDSFFLGSEKERFVITGKGGV